MMRQERQSLPEPALSFRLRRAPLNSATYKTLIRVLSHCRDPAASGDAGRSSPVCPFCSNGDAGPAGYSRSDGCGGLGHGDGVHEASGTATHASPSAPAVPDFKGTPPPQRLTDLIAAGLKLRSRNQSAGRDDASVASPQTSVGGGVPCRPEQKPDDGRGGDRSGREPDDERGGRRCDVLMDSSAETQSSNMASVASVGDTAVNIPGDDPAGPAHDQLLMDLESGFGMEVDEAGILNLQKELSDCIKSSPVKSPQLLGSVDGSTVGVGAAKEGCGKKNVGGGHGADKLMEEKDSESEDPVPTQDVGSILIKPSNHEMDGHRPDAAASSAACQNGRIIIANLSVEPYTEQSTETPIQTHKEQSTETPVETLEPEVPQLSLQHPKLPVSQNDFRTGSAEKTEDDDNDTGKSGTGFAASQNGVILQRPVAGVSCDSGSCNVQSTVQGEEATFSHTGSDNQMPGTNEPGLGVDTVVEEHLDVVVKENSASECSSSASKKFVEDAKANNSNNVSGELIEEGEMEDGEIPNDLENVDQVSDTETEDTTVMDKCLAEKTSSMDTDGNHGGSIFTHNMNVTNGGVKNHLVGLLDYGDLDWLKDETEAVKPMTTSICKKGGDKTKVKARDETSPDNFTQNDEPVKQTVQKKEKSCKSKKGEVRVMTKERKEKKKIAKKRKRAEKNKKLGVKRLKIQPVVMPKKVVDCRHHLLGRCREGEACKFSHDKIPLTKSKPCDHFIHDRCLKGDDCPYDHDLLKYPCHNFTSKGSCIRGAKCKFSHEISAVENVPTRNAESKPGPSTIQGQPGLGIYVKQTCIPPNSVTNAESPLKTSTPQVSMDKQSLGEAQAQIGARAPQKPPKGVCFLSFEKKPMEVESKTQKTLESVGGTFSETWNWPKQVNGLLGSVKRTNEALTSSNARKSPSFVKPACDILRTGNKKPPRPSASKNMAEDSRIHKSGGSPQLSKLSSSASTQTAVTEASRLLQEFLFLGDS